tara:strand:+ start:249 stop:404 length:156 start_codon:yes stop_codon:yes gene_type:complete
MIPDKLLDSSKDNLEVNMVANMDTIKYRTDNLESITFKPTLSNNSNALVLQ